MRLVRVLGFISGVPAEKVPSDNKFGRMYEGMTSHILESSGKIDFGRNGMLHVHYIESSDLDKINPKVQDLLRRFFISGDSILKIGHVYLEFNASTFMNLSQLDQRLYLLETFRQGIIDVSKILNTSTFDINQFNQACESFTNKGCRVTTKLKWNKFRKAQWYLSLERNFALPVVCVLHVKKRGHNVIEEYLVDEITDSKQAPIFFPKVEWLDENKVKLKYWQRTIFINIETKEKECVLHEYHKLENINMW